MVGHVVGRVVGRVVGDVVGHVVGHVMGHVVGHVVVGYMGGGLWVVGCGWWDTPVGSSKPSTRPKGGGRGEIEERSRGDRGEIEGRSRRYRGEIEAYCGEDESARVEGDGGPVAAAGGEAHDALAIGRAQVPYATRVVERGGRKKVLQG